MAEETVQQRSEKFRDTLSSVLHDLSKRNLSYAEAQMLIGSADSDASLSKNTVHKVIDADWITVIEEALPYLDIVVRMPGVTIEDVDEILPVEISRHITEKSIRHLAQHTNLIQKIEGDEITPSRILNVYHEETLFTYENKFVNTLLHRLYAFIEKRYAQIHGTSGVEQNYSLEYTTSFQQETPEGKLAKGKVSLQIELTTPSSATLTEEELIENERYQKNLERLERIHSIVLSYMGSPLVRTLGRTFIRPPVIRTNAILKNKNLKVALNLWEFIESFEKVGFYFSEDAVHQLPADSYISALYSTVAAQYLDFYQSIVGEEDIKRELSRRHLSDIYPEFEDLFNEEDEDEYNIYDSEYRKLVPVSRLLNNKRKLSDDEKRMRIAIAIALAADRTLEENRLAEKRRKAEEELQRQAEEEARARAEADAELARLIGEQPAGEVAPEASAEEVAPVEEPTPETLDTEPAIDSHSEQSEESHSQPDAEPATDSHSERSEESRSEPDAEQAPETEAQSPEEEPVSEVEDISQYLPEPVAYRTNITACPATPVYIGKDILLLFKGDIVLTRKIEDEAKVVFLALSRQQVLALDSKERAKLFVAIQALTDVQSAMATIRRLSEKEKLGFFDRLALSRANRKMDKNTLPYFNKLLPLTEEQYALYQCHSEIATTRVKISGASMWKSLRTLGTEGIVLDDNDTGEGR